MIAAARSPVLVVGLALLGCASSGPAGFVEKQGSDEWIRVESDLRSFTLLDGSTVEIVGSGQLEFREGRRTIRAVAGLTPTDEAGDRLDSGPYAGTVIRLVDAAGTPNWVLTAVDEMPDISGTRIRDTGNAAASITSSTRVRFFIHASPDGSTEFLQPDQDDEDGGARIGARIEAVLDRYAGYGYSGVVAVSSGSSERPIIVAEGRRGGDDTAPMDAATLFEIGSLTKHLTATAILELEDRGQLRVEDPLARWHPELPSAIASISLHQLLIHTAGLPEEVDVPMDDVDAVWDVLAEVTLDADPGTDWRYSNLGYVVLAALVEEIAPGGYRALVGELIERAGVDDISFALDGSDLSRAAVGGRGPLGTGRIIERLPIETTGWDARLGASGVVATIPALLDWFRALLEARVLSPAATRRMFEERPPEIAYGWFYMRGDAGTRIAHGGDTEGFQTYLVHYPEPDAVVAVGINDRRGWRAPVLRALETILLSDTLPELPPPVSVGVAVQALRGVYRMRDGSEIVVEVADDRLRLAASGSEAIAMITGADRELADTLATRSEAADALMTRLIAADTAAVEAYLAESGRADSFWQVWAHLNREHPEPPLDHEVLGTVPERADRLVSFVLVKFAEGDETLRLVWRPHLDGWGTGGDLPTRDFWPVRADRLVSFDPVRSGWVELLVKSDRGTSVLEGSTGRRARAGY